MVRALAAQPLYDWNYKVSEPDFDSWPTLGEDASSRQLVVAVGGAMLELPKVTAPVSFP
jgi:hypothetical protein